MDTQYPSERLVHDETQQRKEVRDEQPRAKCRMRSQDKRLHAEHDLNKQEHKQVFKTAARHDAAGALLKMQSVYQQGNLKTMNGGIDSGQVFFHLC